VTGPSDSLVAAVQTLEQQDFVPLPMAFESRDAEADPLDVATPLAEQSLQMFECHGEPDGTATDQLLTGPEAVCSG
jgi:hypothetical protein